MQPLLSILVRIIHKYTKVHTIHAVKKIIHCRIKNVHTF
jgi:hypothetical protein